MAHVITGKLVGNCKYGENPHQAPAEFYSTATNDPLALDTFVVLEGDTLSFNNYIDLDRLLQIVTHIASARKKNGMRKALVAVGVKHGNACGAAVGDSSAEVLRQMMGGDPLAIFGGLIMVNFTIDESVCEVLAGKLLDAVVAPAFTGGAIAMLRRKTGKCRFVVNPALAEVCDKLDTAPRFRYVRGGFLTQPNYTYLPNFADDTTRRYNADIFFQEADLLLAWAVGSTSNSNTITIVKGDQLLGNGVGQQDRVGAAELAVRRALRSGHDLSGSVAFSDSFFPFPDGPQILIDAGVRAIFTTYGSKNDQATINFCADRGVVLYMVSDQAGRAFFGH